jgi:hypothetical protein
MVEGYAPRKGGRWYGATASLAAEDITEFEVHIFLDGSPTKLSARLYEGQLITLPAIEPFVSDLPYNDLAELPWPEGYSKKYRTAYLDKLFLEPGAVLAWLERFRKEQGPAPAPTPLRGHAFRSGIRAWYRDDWVKGGYAEWLANNGRPVGATPSLKDDLAAAKERFDSRVSRDTDIKPLRRMFAPPEWRKGGRRPQKSR